MGRGGARPCAGRGPADPALDRLLGLPLVPRDGARVVRGRSHGPAHERALRQREGRPRGTARPRLGLHGRGRHPDRPRRLADDRLPHPRGRAVLRGDVLPAGTASRPAELPPGTRGGLLRVPRPPRGHRALGPPAGRRRPPLERAAALARAASACAARWSGPRAGRAVRSPVGRIRPRAEVPARLGARVPRPARRAGHGDQDARRDGRGRDVRPRRRRLPPLLGGRAVARPSLREDALRQRAPRPRLSACVGRHWRREIPQGCGIYARVHASRARAARGRIRLGAGCGHRRRRGPDLHLDARGAGGGAPRPGGPPPAVRARALRGAWRAE